MAAATRLFASMLQSGFILRDGVSFCVAGGRFIFLDLARDRFCSLVGEAEHSFRRLTLGGPLSYGDHAVLSGLIASGLLDLASNDARPLPCTTPPNPVHSLFDEDYPIGPAVLAHAIWQLTRSATALKIRPLRSIIARLERRKARLGTNAEMPSAGLSEVAAAFKRTGLIAAPLDRCLPRSLAAAQALLDRNIAADLVIGTRLQPFGAHCWVQYGSTLVNERVDQVRNFTPILVV